MLLLEPIKFDTSRRISLSFAQINIMSQTKMRNRKSNTHSQPEITSQVIRTLSVHDDNGSLLTFNTSISGSHAAVQKFLSKKAALENEVEATSALRATTPYYKMTKATLIYLLMLYHLAVHERTPWKLLILLPLIAGGLYRVTREPGKYARAHEAAHELSEMNTNLFSRGQRQIRSVGDYMVTVTDLPEGVKVTNTCSIVK